MHGLGRPHAVAVALSTLALSGCRAAAAKQRVAHCHHHLALAARLAAHLAARPAASPPAAAAGRRSGLAAAAAGGAARGQRATLLPTLALGASVRRSLQLCIFAGLLGVPLLQRLLIAVAIGPLPSLRAAACTCGRAGTGVRLRRARLRLLHALLDLQQTRTGWAAMHQLDGMRAEKQAAAHSTHRPRSPTIATRTSCMFSCSCSCRRCRRPISR